MPCLAIVEAFSQLPDSRRGSGQRHHQALCLALCTLAVAAGCRGFLAIGDWLKAYHDELVELFAPAKGRLPSYSTIRRVLLNLDYQQYAACLAKFFELTPQSGEMVAVDGKRLRGSYQLAAEHSTTEPHPAIQLVSVYLVGRGLILEPYQVEQKSNEIKVLPELVKQFACKGVVFAFDAIKKSCQHIVESHKHYLGALKGNQSGLLNAVKATFQVEDTDTEFSKGHGRIEERIVETCPTLDGIRPWAGLCTLIRVRATRTLLKGEYEIVGKTETRYYISSLRETAQQFAHRIRSYWGVENKVHYVRDVTQAEDACRIRIIPLPQIWAIARNLALNLYRVLGFNNMAQAQRRCSFSLKQLKSVFRMK